MFLVSIQERKDERPVFLSGDSYFLSEENIVTYDRREKVKDFFVIVS